MNHDNEELNNTKALDDLNNIINQNKEDIKTNIDEIINIESKEDIYNTITSDEVVINNDIEKEESFFDKLKKMPRKNKIIIVIIIILMLILITLGIVFLINKEDQTEKLDPTPPVNVIVDNGNYRYNNGILEFLDSFGTKIGEYTCTNKDEELCFISYLDNNKDDFNTESNVNEDNSLVEIKSKIYHNRYVFINDGEDSNIILYDVIENKKVDEYLSIKTYGNNDYVIIKNLDNKYGLIEITDNEIKEVIKPTYNYMGKIKDDDILVVETTQGYYLINYESKYLTKVSKNIIYDYNDNYIVTKNNDKYSLYNYNMELINENKDYISLIDTTYYSYVLDNLLYINDYENSKYNQDGYELYNTNYKVVNIYDENNTLIKTDYSYKISIKENTLSIYIKDEDNVIEKSLDLLGGIYSKNLKYYSYLDGTLYFYSDLEKTNLLGKYSCNTKNNLANNALEYCNISYDEIYDDNFKNNGKGMTTNLIPVIANNYVFIVDSSDRSEIKLYNLKDNKVEATYKGVSVGKSTSNEVTFIDSANNIIVKNKSNKFGTISINSNGVTKNLDFTYDSIERIGDSILVKEDNKYYIRYTNTISNEFTNKIYDYNSSYLVVKETNGFAIYKQSDNETSITKDKKMIKLLGDTCYSYVDEEYKLHISLYDNTLINHEEIILPNTNDIYSLYNSYTLSKLDNNKIQVNVFKNGELDKSYTIDLVTSE